MSRQSVSRRVFLGGAAVGVALPFLPSLAPAGESTVPRRLVGWFRPNGDTYLSRPAGNTLDNLPFGMSSLAPVAARSTVVTRLINVQGELSAGDRHLATASTVFRGTLPSEEGEARSQPRSLDQIVAEAHRGKTPLPSLQVGIEAFGTRVGGAISYAAADQPLPPIVDPRAVFDRLFQGADPTLSKEEALRRTVLRTSVLDRVMERTNRLSTRVSTEDGRRLDQFLTGLRELEARIQSLGAIDCMVPESPGTPAGLPEHHHAMRELVAIAIECDLARAITFMAGRGGSQLRYPHLPLQHRPGAGHHDLGHHTYTQDYLEDLAVVQHWLVEQYTLLAERLAATPDGLGGDLLEHTAMVMLTDWGNPNGHTSRDLTMVVTGGEQGGWAHGAHITPWFASHASVLATVGEFCGVSADEVAPDVAPLSLG